ncbi:hypothetical protein GCM10010294_17250 [Streptomyces griseoloalbus]|uniref:hypothetical protein n=1 Tax=Streptomyces griseoloalbus TaxID=67303 RepID=UPI001873B186|nr:hypothetical protein GCM10010294_17250 [Streptomyces griseoloalbus]
MAMTLPPELYSTEVTAWPDVWIGAAATAVGAPPPYDAVTGTRRRAGHRRPGADDGADADGALLRAARAARRRSGVPDGGLDLVIHAPTGAAGARDGTAAAVVRGLGCPRATAWEVRRPTGGALVALHLAAQYVSGRPRTPLTALVTTAGGDPVPYDRLSAGQATGLVLTASAGVARVLATAVLGGGPPHGSLLRSDLAWSVPERHTPRWRRRGHSRGTAAAAGPAGLGERQCEVVRLALAACGRAEDDVVRFLPSPAGSGPSCDGQLAQLPRLLEEEGPQRGETLVLADGDARGFGCAVVEITRVGRSL